MRSQKIIVSTLCLQNLAMRWGEPDMAGESSSEDEGPHDPDLRGAAHEVHWLEKESVTKWHREDMISFTISTFFIFVILCFRIFI